MADIPSLEAAFVAAKRGVEMAFLNFSTVNPAFAADERARRKKKYDEAVDRMYAAERALNAAVNAKAERRHLTGFRHAQPHERERDRAEPAPAPAVRREQDRRLADRSTSPAYPFVLHEFVVAHDDGVRRRLAETERGFVPNGADLLRSAWRPVRALGSGAYGAVVEVVWADDSTAGALVARGLPARYALKFSTVRGSLVKRVGTTTLPDRLTESGTYALVEALRANDPLAYRGVLRCRDWCRVKISLADLLSFKVPGEATVELFGGMGESQYDFPDGDMALQVMLLDLADMDIGDYLERGLFPARDIELMKRVITSLFVQVIAQLCYLNLQTRRFVHSDLNLGNVFATRVDLTAHPERTYLLYELPGTDVRLSIPLAECGAMVFALGDFGHAQVSFYTRNSADGSMGEQSISSNREGESSDVKSFSRNVETMLDNVTADDDAPPLDDWEEFREFVGTKPKPDANWNYAAAYAHLLATHPLFARFRVPPGELTAEQRRITEVARLPASTIAAIAVAPIASEFT